MPTTSPQDLAPFWTQTLHEARATPLNLQIEKIRYPAGHWVYKLTYNSLGSIPIRAYLSTPVNTIRSGRTPKPVPLVVTTTGYGGTEFAHTLSECQRGYAILQIYPRSQGESAELWQVEPKAKQAWIQHGRPGPKGFYYQGAVMDLLRGVDAVLSTDSGRAHEIDPTRVGVNGTSQAGMLALNLAAVDPRITACVSHVPYLCDFPNNSNFASSDEAKDPVFLNTWSYFDPINTAPLIQAATLLSSGGQDKLCPPSTIHAVYQKLPGIKSIAHFPDLTHTASADFYEMGWEWLQRYLQKT
jgi:cephalosporin-C deacetylase